MSGSKSCCLVYTLMLRCIILFICILYIVTSAKLRNSNHNVLCFFCSQHSADRPVSRPGYPRLAPSLQPPVCGDQSTVTLKKSGHILRKFLDCTGGRPPVGSRGEAPVGGLGDEVPQKPKRYNKSPLKFPYFLQQKILIFKQLKPQSSHKIPTLAHWSNMHVNCEPIVVISRCRPNHRLGGSPNLLYKPMR